MSPAQIKNKTIKAELEKLLSQGKIRPSTSDYRSQVMLIKKKDGGHRMCIDYRQLNNQTIKDSTPLPSHVDLRRQIQGARFLTKMDIRDAFHSIRMDPESSKYTAFQTRYGLYEFLVCAFGLCNSPATFMKFMNKIFFKAVDEFLIYFMDDLLIYSKTWEEHLQHIEKTLTILQENNLCVKLSKCEFGKSEIEFCGMLVSAKGISIQHPAKEIMNTYPTPKTVHDVRSFLGSVRFFQEFLWKQSELPMAAGYIARHPIDDLRNIALFTCVRVQLS